MSATNEGAQAGGKRVSERDRNPSTSLRYGLEELKFVRSVRDARILLAKVAYKNSLRRGARGETPDVPPSIQLEPTNLCNLNCTTCPGSRTTFPRGHMDMGLFRKIVTEAAGVGVRRIHLFLRGESTLHPGFLEMVAFIKARRLPIHFTTNGTTLDSELAAGLLGSGVDSSDQLTVSFLGHSKAAHESVMVGVDHDAVVANVLGLVSLRRELGVNGPVVETILNVPADRMDEAGDFLAFWRGRVDHVRIGDISVEFQDYGTDAVDAVRRTEPCNAIFERLCVAWNGQVPQCNGDFDCKSPLGDLNEDGIVDLWHSEQLERLRRLHISRRFDEMPACLHCDM